MAAPHFTSEMEDLITCSVCLNEFSEIRKPKFLICHHTACLPCLNELQRHSAIRCPLCRRKTKHAGDVSNLPSNHYPLEILKLKPPPIQPPPQPCSKCRDCNDCSCPVEKPEVKLPEKAETGEDSDWETISGDSSSESDDEDYEETNDSSSSSSDSEDWGASILSALSTASLGSFQMENGPIRITFNFGRIG